jgi:CRP-like cAMP-binding protein
VQRDLEREGLMQRDEPIETPYPERELDLVQRLVLMRQTGPYRDASLDPLIEMAKRAVEVRYAPGHTLWRAGEPSTWGMHVVHGVVRCTGEDGRRVFRMGPGSVVGYIETYADLPRGYDAVTEGRVVGLRGDTEAFFDVLEDNFELGIAFVGFLASLLTKLYERLAPRGP